MNCGSYLIHSLILDSWLERRSNQLSYEATEFFRLLYAIVKIAFITAKIIASSDKILKSILNLHLKYASCKDETAVPSNVMPI